MASQGFNLNATVPFEFKVSQGLTDHTVTTINAYTDTLSATAGFVLSPKNLYAMTTPSVNTAGAQYMRVTSSQAADATAGTGLVELAIQGVIESGSLTTETIAISGQTPKTTTNKFVAINRIYAYTCGSGGVNAGDIYITGNADSTTAGVPDATSTSYAVMAAGDNRSADARYLVPTGWTAYIQYVTVGQNLSTRDSKFKAFYKEPNKPKQLHAYAVSDSRMAFDFRSPIKLPQNTYWWIEATGAASATSADIIAQFILVNKVE